MSNRYTWNKGDLRDKIQLLDELYHEDDIDFDDKNLIKATIRRYEEMVQILETSGTKHMVFSDSKKSMWKSNDYGMFYETMERIKSYDSFLLGEQVEEIINRLASINIPGKYLYRHIYCSNHEYVQSIRRFCKDHKSIGLSDQLSNIEGVNQSLFYLMNGNKNSMSIESGCFIDEYFHIPYVFLYVLHNMTDPFCLAHELGHAFNLSHYYNYDTIKETLLIEVPAFLMEELLFQYYSDNNIQSSQLRIIRINNYKEMIYMAKLAKVQLDLYRIMEKEGPNDYNLLNNAINQIPKGLSSRAFYSQYNYKLKYIFLI